MDGAPLGPSPSKGRTLAFAVVAVVLSLAILEGVCRLVPFRSWVTGTLLKSPTIDSNVASILVVHGDEHVRRSVADPELLWRNDPHGALDALINSDGFRGREFSVDKPPGVVRVAMLGDSVTFGWNHPDTRTTFASLIEKRLREAGYDVEIYNFATPGYSSFQGRRLLTSDVLKFHPDVVTIQFGWNDHFEAVEYPDKDQSRLGLILKKHGGILNRSALIEVIEIGAVLARQAMQDRPEVPAPDARASIPVLSATDDHLMLRVPPADFADNIRAIVRTARDSGAVPILATAPHDPNVNVCMYKACFSPELHERYIDEVRRIAAEDRVFLADLDKAFASAPTDQLDKLFITHGVHLSPTGHEFASIVWADTIARALGPAPIAKASSKGP